MAAQKRKNEAVTVDGAPYNKRHRPDIFVNGPPPTIYPVAETASQSADDSETTPKSAQFTKKNIWRSRGKGKGKQDFEDDGEPRGRNCLPLTTDVHGFKDIPDNGVLSYLESVRAEAASIPSILHAPQPLNTPHTFNHDDNPERDNSSEPDSEDLPQRIEDDFGDDQEWYEEGYLDEEGEYYEEELDVEDGQVVEEEDDDEGIPPQVAYTSQISQLLLSKRALFRAGPPKGIVAALRDDQLTYCNKRSARLGRKILLSGDPVPAQIACMKQSTVEALLVSCRRLLKANSNISPRVSTWIWALLAHLPESGQLDSDAIYDLRVLAKRAASLRCAFDSETAAIGARMGIGHSRLVVSNGQFNDDSGDSGDEDTPAQPPKGTNGTQAEDKSHQTGDVDDGDQAMDLETDEDAGLTDGKDIQSGDQEALRQAQARLAGRVQTVGASPSEDGEVDETQGLQNGHGHDGVRETELPMDAYPDLNTRVTLDFIIAIVGELYGQRDLLACRETW